MTGSAERHTAMAEVPIGALVGGLVGWVLLRNPVTAIAGAVVGHLLQKEVARHRLPVPKASPARAAPVEAVRRAEGVARAAVALARVDGPLDEQERSAIRAYLARDGGVPAALIPALERGVDAAAAAPAEDPRAAVQGLRWFQRDDRIHTLFVLFRVALADRRLTPAEEQALADVARVLGLSPVDLQEIRELFVSEAPGSAAREDDYKILGLSPEAPPETVKEKYREAAKTYHPDRYQHLGDEFARVASDKFKRIQEAYDRIQSQTAPPPHTWLSVCPRCRGYTMAAIPRCPRCATRKYAEQGGILQCRCPFCTQQNRFPRAALETTVRCGNCRVLLVR